MRRGPFLRPTKSFCFKRRLLQPGAAVNIGDPGRAQLPLSSGGATESDDLHQKIQTIGRSHRGNPAPLVDDTVQDGAVLKRRLESLGVKAAWQCLLDAVPANPVKPALKQGQSWRAKVNLLQDLKKVPGIGPYRAGRLWYFLKGAMRPKACDEAHVELGPGARRG